MWSCHGLLLLAAAIRGVYAEIALGAIAGWTIVDSGELIATIAAIIDYRKNWDASLAARFGPPVVDIPGGVHEDGRNVSLRIGTSHLQPDVGLATALDMMLGLDGALPAVGLVGARASSVSTPAVYPYFLRVVPPDTVQGLALWSWILHFDAPLAICLYSTETRHAKERLLVSS
ncbi:hypothetical protein AK812_SmicGene12232 [Symbiodinium microadriaticum]|uniref:Uncharacterized protein n=1 Tax=Symbiodinium microadriaticum TaxID=2951 RepID=A0A1Q9EB63_SYMMI|nr:hypothetical protein AK812_SmicGene12232 [Symbiodinium microadriaticum]